jgi:hypothetical protein
MRKTIPEVLSLVRTEFGGTIPGERVKRGERTEWGCSTNVLCSVDGDIFELEEGSTCCVRHATKCLPAEGECAVFSTVEVRELRRSGYYIHQSFVIRIRCLICKGHRFSRKIQGSEVQPEGHIVDESLGESV